MFRLFRDPERQPINGVRVTCPVRSADVDLDVCFRCASLIELEVRHGRPFVHCIGAKAKPPAIGRIS